MATTKAALQRTLLRRDRAGIFFGMALRGVKRPQISNRADRIIARPRLLHGNVALFSHSHFGRVLAARWIGLQVEQARHLLLTTASVSVLCYEHDGAGESAIALWNSATQETFGMKPGQRETKLTVKAPDKAAKEVNQ